MASNRLSGYATMAAVLIGLMPIWMVLLPFEFTDKPAQWQIYVRAYSFAVPLVQSIFVLIAMSGSFSLFAVVEKLPSITKASLLICLVIACFVSFQPDKDLLSAFIGLAKFIFAGLFFLALVEMRNSFGQPFLRTLWVSIGCGILLYTILWIGFIFVFVPKGDEWIYKIPGVNNVRHTGHFAFAGVAAGLFTLIAFRDSSSFAARLTLPLLLGSVGLGIALWTGSRGPLLASLALIFATFCLAAGSRQLIFKFFIGSAFLATAVAAVLPVPHRAYGIAGATGMTDVSAQSDDELTSGRIYLWTGTIEKIREKPLFGWGINQFGKSGPDMPSRLLHPHSFPLQLIFSGGIMSVLFLLLIFVPALRRWNWPNIKGPNAAGTGAVIGLLIYSLYDGVLYFSYPTMIFLIAIASSIAPAGQQRAPDMSG